MSNIKLIVATGVFCLYILFARITIHYMFHNGKKKQEKKNLTMTDLQNRIYFIYVNMDHRVDRRLQFTNEMKIHGVPIKQLHRVPGRYHRLPTLGASYAWLDAWHLCASSAPRNNICCVFDDDFEFVAPYAQNVSLVRELFLTILRQNADAVCLSGNEKLSPHNMKTIVEHNHFAWRAVDLIGEAAVCSRVSYVKDSIIENVQEGITLHEAAFARTGSWVTAYCIDVYLTLLQKRDLWLYPKLTPGTQRPSWSNIEGRFVNNKTGTKKSE